MKRMMKFSSILASLVLGLGAASAMASDAETSATAGGDPRRPTGNAAATARYEGDAGFARTVTQSGRVNLARGVAVGIDEDGLSLSISQAVATQNGPAVATNFNLSIDRDGDVSASGGGTISNGPVQRSATAGGSAGNNRPATSIASGSSDSHGHVQAQTWARQHEARPQPVREIRPGGMVGNGRGSGLVVGNGRVVGEDSREVRRVRRW